MLSDQDVADELERSINTIKYFRIRNKLRRNGTTVKAASNTVEKEDHSDFLKNNYDRFSNESLAKLLGTTATKIENELTRLGLARFRHSCE